MNHLY